jgi:hypothetical protein
MENQELVEQKPALFSKQAGSLFVRMSPVGSSAILVLLAWFGWGAFHMLILLAKWRTSKAGRMVEEHETKA